MSRVTHQHTWMSPATHTNESRNTYEWVMSPIWMSHVTHMNESCHASAQIVWHGHFSHLSFFFSLFPLSLSLWLFLSLFISLFLARVHFILNESESAVVVAKRSEYYTGIVRYNWREDIVCYNWREGIVCVKEREGIGCVIEWENIVCVRQREGIGFRD